MGLHKDYRHWISAGVLEMKRVGVGMTLINFIDKYIKKKHITEDSSNVFVFMMIDLLNYILTLNSLKLYHNDLHANNIVVNIFKYKIKSGKVLQLPKCFIIDIGRVNDKLTYNDTDYIEVKIEK